MPKSKDSLTGSPFEGPEKHNSPEFLERNEAGEVVDDAGNVYDELGQKIREAPSEYLIKALELARKEHPEVGPDDPLVQHYVRELRLRDKGKQEK